MLLTEEQVKAIDDLDGALCQFLNNASDAYDPRYWIPSIRNDFKRLSEAYNQCHVLDIMDLMRAADGLDEK